MIYVRQPLFNQSAPHGLDFLGFHDKMVHEKVEWLLKRNGDAFGCVLRVYKRGAVFHAESRFGVPRRHGCRG